MYFSASSDFKEKLAAHLKTQLDPRSLDLSFIKKWLVKPQYFGGSNLLWLNWIWNFYDHDLVYAISDLSESLCDIYWKKKILKFLDSI